MPTCWPVPVSARRRSFFLSDLYGPKDFSSRDEEVERILPLLIRMLPASALHTVALAVELDALSEELDSAMVAELRRNGRIDASTKTLMPPPTAASIASPSAERQIVLIRETGEALDKLARKPLLNGMLRLMRGPAQVAGLGDLHEFLDRGFNAFRGMGSATEFLDSIERKEQPTADRALFSGTADPFADRSATSAHAACHGRFVHFVTQNDKYSLSQIRGIFIYSIRICRRGLPPPPPPLPRECRGEASPTRPAPLCAGRFF
jgi:hypothetical protein